jgi:hypothetical protein
VAVGLLLKSEIAHANCPNISKAIEVLNKAENELQTANHDFNGHRGDAVAAVGKAVAQLGLCLQATQCTR